MPATLLFAGVLSFSTMSCGDSGGGDADTASADTSQTDTALADTVPGEDVGPNVAADTTPADTTPADTTPAGTCADSEKNGSESDVDCGGAACPKCDAGDACGGGADCVSGACDQGVCSPFTVRTIAAIQLDASSAGCTEEVADLQTQGLIRTTGIVTSPIFSASDGLDGAYLGAPTSAPNSGLLVVWPHTIGLSNIVPGARVTVSGRVKEFYCLTELVASEVQVLDTKPIPTALTLTVAALASEQYEGTLVRIEDVDVTAVGDGYLTVDGSLNVDLGHFSPAFALGTPHFAAIEGVVTYTFGAYHLDALRLVAPEDPCAATPCANGGTCAAAAGGFTCTCAAGYEGATCETDSDECAVSDPCPSGAACYDGVNSYTCQGDSCDAPRPLSADGPNRWVGSGDTSHPALSDNVHTTGCAQLGVFPSEGPAADEVWSFVATAPGDYRVVASTAPTDVLIYAFAGAGCGGTCFGYMDDPGAPTVDLPGVAAGDTITVVVDGWDAVIKGAYTLTVERIACPDGECVVPGGEQDLALHQVVIGGNDLPVISSQTQNSGLMLRLCETPTCASGTTHEHFVPSVGAYSVAASPGADGGVWLAHPNTSGKLELKRCAGLPWITWPTLMTTTGGTVFQTSVAVTRVDDKDVAGVVWTESTGAQTWDLKFANKFDGVATTPFVPVTIASNVDSPRVAFGADGMPVILHRSGNADVGFTWNVTHCGSISCSTKITFTVATMAGSVTSKLDFAIGKNGFPIMVYSSSPTAFTFVVCGDSICGAGNLTTRILAPNPAPKVNFGPSLAVPLLPGTGPSFAYYSADSVLNVQRCSDATCANSFLQVFRPSAATDGQGIAVGADGDLVLVYRANTTDSPTMLKRLVIPTF
ncbi:MAG: hypothetical protein CVU56_11165 [Deltaproteobacteria bacterium HGW-Deltaproteobacteria-14]|nr:MAG: hypothetical protein CVU56_11165 [Deltaproteobacteria bacterium HGW-Deltaproteobacteria-14]